MLTKRASAFFTRTPRTRQAYHALHTENPSSPANDISVSCMSF